MFCCDINFVVCYLKKNEKKLALSILPSNKNNLLYSKFKVLNNIIVK